MGENKCPLYLNLNRLQISSVQSIEYGVKFMEHSIFNLNRLHILSVQSIEYGIEYGLKFMDGICNGDNDFLQDCVLLLD